MAQILYFLAIDFHLEICYCRHSFSKARMSTAGTYKRTPIDKPIDNKQATELWQNTERKIMENDIKTPPPKLKLPPKVKRKQPPAGCRLSPDKPLEVRMVNGIDVDSLLFNILTVVGIFVILSIGLRFIKHDPSVDRFLTVTIPLVAVWVFILLNVKKFGANVESRQAKIYLDYLRPGKIIAYLPGFHFTTWCSRIQEGPVSFQKHEKIAAKRASNSEIKFRSQDGYEMYADVTILYNRRDDLDALRKSLRYFDDEIKDWTLAVVSERISSLAGRNSCETLIYHKGKVIEYVGSMFGGEGVISDFEDQVGTDVKNPVAEVFDLTPEAQKIYSTRAKIDVINAGIKALRKANPDMHVNEASRTAQAAEGIATREIKTFEAEGLGNAQTVVLGGDSGFAVTGKEKGK